MTFEETFHYAVNYFSQLAAIISIMMYIFFVAKARSTRPYTLLAVSTAGLIVGRKLRTIIVLMLTSSLILFAAYVEKYYLGNQLVYWSLEAISLLLFLISGIRAVLLSVSHLGKRE
jgi:hypothetical protein